MSEDTNDIGYHTEGFCPRCCSPTVVETARGWWCTNSACNLSKSRKDTRAADKYRPHDGVNFVVAQCEPPRAFTEMSNADLIDFLIEETSEDAVFAFITTIAVFGVCDRADAIAAMEQDDDTRKWAELTAQLIPQPTTL